MPCWPTQCHHLDQPAGAVLGGGVAARPLQRHELVDRGDADDAGRRGRRSTMRRAARWPHANRAISRADEPARSVELARRTARSDRGRIVDAARRDRRARRRARRSPPSEPRTGGEVDPGGARRARPGPRTRATVSRGSPRRVPGDARGRSPCGRARPRSQRPMPELPPVTMAEAHAHCRSFPHARRSGTLRTCQPSRRTPGSTAARRPRRGLDG